MAKIFLSCGHEIDDLDHAHYALIKSTDREGNKAIACMLICGSCEDQYRQSGQILDSKDAADAWLERDTW
jgi:hypothetical protein